MNGAGSCSEEKWGGLERDYDYRYYPRWHSYGWYHHHHQRQAPTLGISLPASDPSAPSFRDVFDSFTGQLDNNALITATKRDIARLRTELRIREIGAAEALEEANDG